MFISLLAEALPDDQPWWLNAVLGSLGALVLAVIGNVAQWRRATTKEKEWETERGILMNSVKAETERATKYGENCLIMMTKAEIHLGEAPSALREVRDSMEGQHVTTREHIDKAFKALKE